MDFRFSRKNRLTKWETIRAVLKRGRSVSGRIVRIYWLERPSPAAQDLVKKTRLAVIVKRAARESAAERNRSKRIVREFFRLHQNQLSSRLDVAVIVLHKLSDDRDLGKELKGLFARVK